MSDIQHQGNFDFRIHFIAISYEFDTIKPMPKGTQNIKTHTYITEEIVRLQTLLYRFQLIIASVSSLADPLHSKEFFFSVCKSLFVVAIVHSNGYFYYCFIFLLLTSEISMYTYSIVVMFTYAMQLSYDQMSYHGKFCRVYLNKVNSECFMILASDLHTLPICFVWMTFICSIFSTFCQMRCSEFGSCNCI